MGRGRAAGYNDQRESILEHAAHLFARRGYPSTSMNQVAEASGLSKATLYHYYRDKYSLLVSIAEGHVSRLQSLVIEVEQENLPPERRLRDRRARRELRLRCRVQLVERLRPDALPEPALLDGRPQPRQRLRRVQPLLDKAGQVVTDVG